MTHLTTHNPIPLRLGLTMWSHNPWLRSFYGKGTSNAERLSKYAEVFHTVEGNTTFYALPSARTVLNWRDATPDTFRFTFKLPRTITHERLLKGCQSELKAMLNLFEPLFDKIGLWTIQLPASFSYQELERLKKFVTFFPDSVPLGVEVRHSCFFAKGEEERHFNQFLIERDISRIIMDSRPVFSPQAQRIKTSLNGKVLEELLDAQSNKPHVPVHAIATSDFPMVRFIGLPHPDDNLEFLTPWLNKVPQWIAEGKQPYFMIHSSDNDFAPQLACKFYKQLGEHIALPPLGEFPAFKGPQQISMF
ncbi:DUF72 domain-containing protein [Vibrio sp. RC27]